MELKEYFKILKDNAKIFWGVVILVVAGSYAYFQLRPVSYLTSLALNISRQGKQETSEYKYDDFYRLQADEKFAETIVQWLQSPRTVTDIYAKAGIDTRQLTLRQLSKSLKAEKLSSQLVAVKFSAVNETAAQKISHSLVTVISENTENLNQKQNENTWFAIMAHEPIIAKNIFDPLNVLIVSLIVGIFVAFWSVLFRHYMM